MNFNAASSNSLLGPVMLLGALISWLLLLLALPAVIRSRYEPTERVMWVIVVIFVPVFGPFFWWFRPGPR